MKCDYCGSDLIRVPIKIHTGHIGLKSGNEIVADAVQVECVNESCDCAWLDAGEMKKIRELIKEQS